MAKANDAPAVGTQLPNPYTPGKPYEAPPGATIATVIKLWSGGENGKALETFKTLKPSAADVAKVRAECPGWDELANQ